MKVDRNEYNYFLKNILDSIEQSSDIYENDTFKVVAMASLELMWNNLDVDFYFHNYDVSEKDFRNYFEHRTQEANIKEYIHWVMFNSEKEENQDEATK